MSVVNKNKQFEKETIHKVALAMKISYDEALSLYKGLSQKKKRKLISTYFYIYFWMVSFL